MPDENGSYPSFALIASIGAFVWSFCVITLVIPAAAASASECRFIRSPRPRPRYSRITPVPAFSARPVSRSE